MSNERFHILTPASPRGASLTEQADDLHHQLSALQKRHGLDTLLQARLYLSDAANQYEPLRQHRLLNDLTTTGVFTYIEQPPLNGHKLALLLWFAGEKVLTRQTTRLPDGALSVIDTAEGLSYVVQTVRWNAAQAAQTDAYEQTAGAFKSHTDRLAALGMNLKDHCHRTWIYVRDVDRHYAAAVKARNDLFDREGLTADTHYIASTGIGGATEPRESLVAIDFFSVKGLRPEQVGYLHATDYLNPTREYGVAFERGTWLDLPSGRHYFISGTASIDRHGDCLHRGDVLTQAGRLFLNIEKLLEDGGGSLSEVGYFIVYLRDVADYAAINTYLHLRFPHTPFLITEARVCRPEWLIEVECIAVRP